VLKLNIGAGDHPLPGWVNVDLYSGHPVIGRMDATQPFPFIGGEFDYIFSEHMIEHVTYEQGDYMLTECYRVLKPGGKIRISTPDIEFLMHLLGGRHPEYTSWAAKAFGLFSDEPAAVVNNFMRAWGHQFIHSSATLGGAVESVGFTILGWPSISHSDDPELRGLENDTRMPPGFLQLETMTLEAQKPEPEW
jgi:predicted SAM-dependent methyltransferase